MLVNKDIIEKLSLEEKASLCAGSDYWTTKDIERVGIPKIKMSDGPHGLRVQNNKADNLGINESEISICFPSCATVANSWDLNLIYKMGKALGEEANSEGVNIVLGPGVNIKRSPLCGRNFEYFSEDPYLAGKLGEYYVKGIQEEGVGACVKHFAGNNQENRRRTIDSIIDERTLREIYLKPFEIIVKNSMPWAVMSAYNKLDGDYCTENNKLLGILKNEWKHCGIVITDWGAENDRVKGLIAGNELEMPGKRGNGKEEIINAVKNGELKEEILDESIDRLLSVVFKAKENEKRNAEYDKEKHHDLARIIAEKSSVLLKNEGNILPIKEGVKLAIIGDMAKNPRYQGAGSSTINPYKLENVYDVLEERNIKFEYCRGYERLESKDDKKLLEEAIEVAKKNDVVIIFAGLTEEYESEGIDRNTIDLPKNQNDLIEEISKVNKNVIVVLSHGSSITMPWNNKVQAILTGYLGGEAGASAIVNILYGKVNPSGKLSETYSIKLEDTPCYNYFPGNEVYSDYKEGIYVGYRYYDTSKVDVLYPFGYGLSYTEFEYSNLQVEQNNTDIELSFDIKNTGKMNGEEISQIYISELDSKVFKPIKELKSFAKTEIEVGKTKKVNIKLDRKAFEYYNIETNKWSVESGKYKILIGKSVKDIVLEKEITIKSDDENIKKIVSDKYYSGKIKDITDEEFENLLGRKLPNKKINKKDFSEENTIEQMKNTFLGGIVYRKNIKKMKKLIKEKNINKAIKVMMDIQKPVKKFYEKKNSKYNEGKIKGFIEINKGNTFKGIKMIIKSKKD